jgi:hypothetical protein
VEGLKRNPQFRAECDAAIMEFIEVFYSPDILKELQEKMPYDFGDPLKSPSIIRAWMDYAPIAERLGKRWGLIQAWHYECPDFPPPINYYVAYLKPVKEIKPTIQDSYDARKNPEKYYLDDNGMLHIVINPRAPKGEIRKWVESEIDKFHPPVKGDKHSKAEKDFEYFDFYLKGKSAWWITKKYNPSLINLTPDTCRKHNCDIRREYRILNQREMDNYVSNECGKKDGCLLAQALLKNVKDGIARAKNIINSIKPIE